MSDKNNWVEIITKEIHDNVDKLKPDVRDSVYTKSENYFDILQDILEYEKKIEDMVDKRVFNAQIWDHREQLLHFLKIMMIIETFLLFAIIVLASIPFPSLRLMINDTTLQILVGATIAQISAMIFVIVKSVFPIN